MDEGKYAQAETLLSEALAIDQRVQGPEHPDTLATMMNLGNAELYQGKTAQSEKLHAQALEISKRVLGPDHPRTLTAMVALGNDYMEEGKYQVAEALDQQALEVAKRVAGPEDAVTATIKYNMACLRAHLGDKSGAIALLADAVDHGFPPGDALGIDTDSDLASLHGDPRFSALIAHAKQVASLNTVAPPPSQ